MQKQKSESLVQMRQRNLAKFVANSLAEHSGNPEVQLQEMLSLIVEESRWKDFETEHLPDLFKTLARKFELVNEKLVQAENDSERFQSELAAIKASGNDRRDEINQEKLQRELIEADYIKLNA